MGTLRIGVIGAGHWGPNLIRNFNDPHRSRVTHVADLNPDRLEEVRRRSPEVVVTARVDDVLYSDVDAVAIATPTSTHFELVQAALRADKHVFVEKPLTHDVDGARALCALAEQRGRTVLVGHVFLFNPAVRRAKDYLERGTLGPVHYISSTRTNLGPVRGDVNAAWDLAAQDISIFNYWLGAQPVAVSARGGAWINDGIEDVVFAVLRYPGDVLAHVHASWLHPRKTREITIVGGAQMLTFDDMNPGEPLRIFDKRIGDEATQPGYVDSIAAFRASVREGDITIPKVPRVEPLAAECQHFLDCIEGAATPLVDARAGLAVVECLAAIDRSLRSDGGEAALKGP